MNKGRALRLVGRTIFGRNNLIGTDFAGVSAREVDTEFEQDSSGGIRVCFSVSHHALGKIMTEELSEALDRLLEPDEDS